MNRRHAYGAASAYGSYLRAGDPGACMFSFFFEDGRPYSEEHRAMVIAWLERQRVETDKEREERLHLIEFMRTTELRPSQP
ncbi:MAG: hypothetical protein IKE42_15135 [Aquamicrobium sp.]|nr:hypothetical protein [Aquamicrobium sp.]